MRNELMDKGTPIITHTWAISFTVPAFYGKEVLIRREENHYIGVEASTVEEAMSAAREQWPDARFTAVNHRGPIHLKYKKTQ